MKLPWFQEYFFCQFNQRLNEIFGYSGTEPLQDFRSLFVRIFFQLPAVKGLPIYSSAASIKGFIA